MARVLANRLGRRFHYLHAPLLVGSAQMQQALVNQAGTHKTPEMARRATLSVVRIGSVEPNISSLLRAGYLTKKGIGRHPRVWCSGRDLRSSVQPRGETLDMELNECVVGAHCVALRGIRCVIGVGGGLLEAQAVLGSLRAGLVDVLVFDAQTVEQVLHPNKWYPLWVVTNQRGNTIRM
jgi:DNA-binding transcriptional regulator LsrR (DeoR family)